MEEKNAGAAAARTKAHWVFTQSFNPAKHRERESFIVFKTVGRLNNGQYTGAQ